MGSRFLHRWLWLNLIQKKLPNTKLKRLRDIVLQVSSANFLFHHKNKKKTFLWTSLTQHELVLAFSFQRLVGMPFTLLSHMNYTLAVKTLSNTCHFICSGFLSEQLF
jgi:hypothetical protein